MNHHVVCELTLAGSSLTLAVDVEEISACSYSSSTGSSFTLARGGEGDDFLSSVSVCPSCFRSKNTEHFNDDQKEERRLCKKIFLTEERLTESDLGKDNFTTFIPFTTAAGEELSLPADRRRKTAQVQKKAKQKTVRAQNNINTLMELENVIFGKGFLFLKLDYCSRSMMTNSEPFSFC